MKTRWSDAAMGWMFSAGIHVLLLLGTALVFMEQLVAFDVEATSYTFGVSDPTPKLDPVLHRDVFDRKGVAPEDGDPFNPESGPTFFPGPTEPWLPDSEDFAGAGDRVAYNPLERGQTIPSALAIFADHPRRTAENRYTFLRDPSRGGCPILRLY